MIFPKNIYILNVEKNKETYNCNSSHAWNDSYCPYGVCKYFKNNFYDSINVLKDSQLVSYKSGISYFPSVKKIRLK